MLGLKTISLHVFFFSIFLVSQRLFSLVPPLPFKSSPCYGWMCSKILVTSKFNVCLFWLSKIHSYSVWSGLSCNLMVLHTTDWYRLHGSVAIHWPQTEWNKILQPNFWEHQLQEIWLYVVSHLGTLNSRGLGDLIRPECHTVSCTERWQRLAEQDEQRHWSRHRYHRQPSAVSGFAETVEHHRRL